MSRPAHTLMVVGTCSSAGKSTLVTALCRIFARRGLRVAPFKSQNMSLNSAVTPEGHEIGRSTFAQAESAGITPHVDMNPVLLKPEGDRRSQVILAGKPHGHIEARAWQARKPKFWDAITAALNRLRSRCDLVIMEGAGSPAEINLPHDIANLRVARHAAAPALLVGDIDRGGVFASLVGTMMLLPPEERRLVRGFVINKMRGDLALLGEGPELLRRHAFDVPTLGVIPFLSDLGLAEEDSVALDRRLDNDPLDADSLASQDDVDLAVIRYPRISNFDDFDALEAEPGVGLRYVDRHHALGTPTAVILPGSKNTLSDLEWLRASGLADGILELARSGTAVIGLCGGFQMLGQSLSDPDGCEGPPGREASGLALLPASTRFAAAKTTQQVTASSLHQLPPSWAPFTGQQITGYEIHMGQSDIQSEPVGITAQALFRLDDGRLDGCIDSTGKIWGTYLHGLFVNDSFRHGWLRSLGWRQDGVSFERGPAYDRLADHVEHHLDLVAIQRMIWPDGLRSRTG